MNKELFIIVACWICALIILIFVIPREKRRYYQIIFLFGQAFAWLFEYIQVVFHLVEFPYREFEYATKMSFSLHYIILPTFAIGFILLYPIDKSRKRIFIHYLIFGVALPTFTLILNQTSDLIHFNKWNWFLSVLINFLILFVVKKFSVWFYKGLKYV